MAQIVRGPARDMARDHSMAPPIAGPDEVPAACAHCHAGGKNAETVAAAWKKLPQGAASTSRHRIMEAIDASAKGDAKALSLLAHLVGEDRGWFVRWAALQMLQSAAAGPESQRELGPVRTALSDPNPAIRRAAARALASCGSPKDIPALQHASDDADPWVALEATIAMGRLGSPTAGARLFQVTKRPDLIGDARAQYQYGHACLVGQDLGHAEEALRRALELNPMMVRAMNDLGLALMGRKKRDEAIAQWNAALDVNPQYSAAKRNIETAASR
jgi:HEAT repeat protein